MSPASRIAILRLCACAVMAVCAMSASALIPPSRTLPSYIKRVYIREFKNNSRWFGAQADLTLYVNDEFMLDGRLDVVQNERADVRLEGKVKNYVERPSGFNSDRFPLITSLQLVCTIELWDPYDSDRLAPIARYTVPTVIQYVSDARRSISETLTEARERLMRQAARNIVHAVMEGQPDADRAIDVANKDAYAKRRGAQKFEPVITEPRFPKPTPASSTHERETDEQLIERIESQTTTLRDR